MISKNFVVAVAGTLIVSLLGGFALSANSLNLLETPKKEISKTGEKDKTKKTKAVKAKLITGLDANMTQYDEKKVPKKAKSKTKAKEVGVFLKDPYTEIDKFEKETGQKVKVFLWYQSSAEDFNVELANWLTKRGIKLQLAWEPHNPAKGVNEQPEFSLKSISRGNHDAAIKKWAKQIKSYGQPLYFRPMSEMNGDWVVWSGVNNGNVPAEYIPAWRRVHNIFEKEGATNAKFIWAPNREIDMASANATFDKYYPGGEYVDYIGINGYNWGTMYNTPAWTSSWQTFDEIFGPMYKVATERTVKQIIIPEMATANAGGNRAQWIKDAFGSMKTKYPKIKTVVWFNVDKETDWRINTSPALAAAFKQSTNKFILN